MRSLLNERSPAEWVAVTLSLLLIFFILLIVFSG